MKMTKPLVSKMLTLSVDNNTNYEIIYDFYTIENRCKIDVCVPKGKRYSTIVSMDEFREKNLGDIVNFELRLFETKEYETWAIVN